MSLRESHRERLWTVYLLCMAEGLALGFMQTAYSSWVVRERATPKQVSLMVALFTLGVALKPLWGLLVDQFPGPHGERRRRWILGGQVGMALAAGICALLPNIARDLAWIAVACFLLGAFMGLQDVSLDGLMYDVIPDSQRPRTNAAFVLGQLTGYVIAAAGIAQAFSQRGHRLAFGLLAAGIFALASPVVLFRENQGAITPGPPIGFRTPTRALLAPSCIVMLLCITLYATSSQLARTSFEYYAVRDLKWPPAQFSFDWGTVTALGWLIGAFLGATLAQHFGPLRFLRLCAVGYGAIHVVFGLLPSARATSARMLTIWCLLAVIAAAAAVALYSLLQRLTWRRIAASQLGIFTGTNYFGTALGVWMAGRQYGLVRFEITLVAVGLTTVALVWPLGSIDVISTQARYRALEPDLEPWT